MKGWKYIESTPNCELYVQVWENIVFDYILETSETFLSILKSSSESGVAFIVWNFKSLQHWVEAILKLENQSLWQKLNSFTLIWPWKDLLSIDKSPKIWIRSINLILPVWMVGTWTAGFTRIKEPQGTQGTTFTEIKFIILTFQKNWYLL